MKQDFNRNKEKISEYIKYAENWQTILVICSYTAMACDVLLIVNNDCFLLKYCKTMQAMLAAFLQTHTKNSGIQSVQADQIGRTYPPLFTINLPKEEEILEDFKRNFHNGICCAGYCDYCVHSSCNYYHVFLLHKCRHTHTIFRYCFPFVPISRIVCMSTRTDLFVKVTNITKVTVYGHILQ